MYVASMTCSGQNCSEKTRSGTARTRCAAGAIALALTAVASADPYSQLNFDMTGFEVSFYSGANGTGTQLASVSAGGGLNFTGSWEFSFSNGALMGNSVMGNNLTGGQGPFLHAGTAQLSGFEGVARMNIVNGIVEYARFVIEVPNAANGVDVFGFGYDDSSHVNNIAIQQAIGGAWTVDGFGEMGFYKGGIFDGDGDNILGDDVDLSVFNMGPFAPFSYIPTTLFRVQNDGSNMDVNLIFDSGANAIPMPLTSAMGFAGLIAIGSVRRRR
ncbi:MAG: hypothetical protein H6815_14210 [Phycisphaeraceae bacterium]|nr:hypothetical protein [Phycisphaerales bacterium]MCB9861594.1 hypothetical protein [Phycisphaeraceae bacterium]